MELDKICFSDLVFKTSQQMNEWQSTRTTDSSERYQYELVSSVAPLLTDAFSDDSGGYELNEDFYRDSNYVAEPLILNGMRIRTS